MKLLTCAKCNQVFNLGFEYQECRGGHGGGQYTDRLNAKVWGDPANIFVLGFANSSFVNALHDQVHYGDQLAEYLPGYGVVPKGREFTAFVIPNAALTVTRVADRFDPIEPRILSQTRGA